MIKNSGEETRTYKIMSKGTGIAFLVWISAWALIHFFGSTKETDSHPLAISEHGETRYITSVQASILHWIGIAAIGISIILIIYYLFDKFWNETKKS